ncbi:hypothetical protein SESBI_14864 [Sesbania bispinosa]|nr:hypothetical protein SESBI_14864 [Sesbania bispinosa]
MPQDKEGSGIRILIMKKERLFLHVAPPFNSTTTNTIIHTMHQPAPFILRSRLNHIPQHRCAVVIVNLITLSHRKPSPSAAQSGPFHLPGNCITTCFVDICCFLS